MNGGFFFAKRWCWRGLVGGTCFMKNISAFLGVQGICDETSTLFVPENVELSFPAPFFLGGGFRDFFVFTPRKRGNDPI